MTDTDDLGCPTNDAHKTSRQIDGRQDRNIWNDAFLRFQVISQADLPESGKLTAKIASSITFLR